MEHDVPGFVERLINLILQVVGFIAAILFGTFSILSWQASIKAAEEATSANLIAFLSLCSGEKRTVSTTVPPSKTANLRTNRLFRQRALNTPCNRAFRDSHKQLGDWVNATFDTNTRSTSGGTSGHNTNKGLSPGLSAAVVVSVLGFVFTVLAVIANYQKFQRRRNTAKSTLCLAEKS
jgi:hypothetical protein